MLTLNDHGASFVYYAGVYFALFWEMLSILCSNCLCGVRKPPYGLWPSLQDVAMGNNRRNENQNPA